LHQLLKKSRGRMIIYKGAGGGKTGESISEPIEVTKTGGLSVARQDRLPDSG